MKKVMACLMVLTAALLTGCAKPQKPYDYTAFRESKPRSILVLPPINRSPDIKAGAGLMSQVSMPLSESGFYVFPVALSDETFKQNGVTSADDAQALNTVKLKEIFGADAALYLTITDYGTSYKVITSDTRVSASARLVDLRSGKQLWSGAATASSAENDSSSGGLLAMLITAAINQVAGTITDKGHTIAGVTSVRLLTAGGEGNLLYGPRSPHYAKAM